MSDFWLSAGVLGGLMVIAGLIGLVSERFHLLMVLLFLEVVMLGLFFFLLSAWESSGLDGYLCLIFLSFSVCEAAVGLSLLVSMIRSHGTDFVSVLSLYEC